LAAWVGGGLAQGEHTRAEAHVADCARCQAVLAAMARMPSALPSSASPWTVRRLVTWLVPLAAGAAVVALWLRMPQPLAPALHREPAPAREAAASRERFEQRAPSQQSRYDRDRNGAARKTLGEVGAPKPVQAKAADMTTPAQAPKERALQPAPPNTIRPAPAGPAPAQETLQLAPANAARSAPARPGPTQGTPQPAPANVAGEPQALAARAGIRALAESVIVDKNSPAIEIVSPDSSIRWRIIDSARVERSTDAGSTWDTLSTGIPAQLTAGSSPAPSICWLVGRAAMVVLSTDGGRSWHRLTFPEAIDLIAVRAADASSAAVTAIDGRTFATQDGGLTWAAIPLQPLSP